MVETRKQIWERIKRYETRIFEIQKTLVVDFSILTYSEVEQKKHQFLLLNNKRSNALGKYYEMKAKGLKQIDTGIDQMR